MSIQIKNIILADRLRLIGHLVTLDGGSNAVWKTKAYFKAADLLSGLDVPASTVKDFEVFVGIGKSLSGTISELIETGTCQQLEFLRQKHPNAEEAFKLMTVSGIGVKKAIGLYDQGIFNLQMLAEACDAGKISNQQIVRGVKLALRSRGRLPINEVLPTVRSILNLIKSSPEVSRAEFAGSVRRGSETIKDVDLIVVSKNRAKTSALFTSLGEVLIAGEEKARIMVPIDSTTSVQVDLLFTNPDSFGSALAYFTGSKEHNIALRRLANELGHTVNEHGFFTLQGHRWGGAEEEELYQGLGLPWCPPELREGDQLLMEIPELITKADLTGDYHSHSTYSSDARSSVWDMVAAAKEKGLKSLGLTDHTEIQYGWDPAEIAERRKECQNASEKLGIQVFAGCETGVNLDGSLDWPDQYLNQVDYVIASIHKSHQNDPIGRLIQAAQHPKVRIIGHPTGRMLGRREIPEGDWGELFKVCAAKGILLEINGARLDLPVHLIHQAKELGCRFVLNSDAHSAVDQLEWQDYALMLGRRAGLTKQDLGKP